jgi:hypothetical protein
MTSAVWPQSKTGAQISQTVQSLLIAGNFGQLESMAGDFRRSGARVSGGTPKIHVFYDALSAISGGCTCSMIEAEFPFETKRAAIVKWLETYPASVTARVAMAQLWINYAWVGRGIGNASDTSDEQWKNYHERLRTAERYLHGVDPRHDLFVYYERIELMEVLPPGRETLDAAYLAGIQSDPTYFPLYESRAWMMQEKWYGNPGELAEFTQSLRLVPGGETGEIAYATVASEFYKVFAWYHVYQKVGLSWPVLKKAYLAKEKRYGLSQTDWDAMLGYSGVARDSVFASEQISLARQRAIAGSTFDQENLGRAYFNGFGIMPDVQQAIRWYEMAAMQGDLSAEFNLASIYEHAAVPDYKEAMKWYEMAAAHGNATAINNMAFMYENGKGVRQDYGKAAALYLQSANKGFPRAAFHIGTLYEHGLGVAKNPDRAVAWMKNAAQSGDIDAAHWLNEHAQNTPVN